MPTVAEARLLAMKTPKKPRQRKANSIAVEISTEETPSARSAEDTIAAALHEEEEAWRIEQAEATAKKRRQRTPSVTQL